MILPIAGKTLSSDQQKTLGQRIQGAVLEGAPLQVLDSKDVDQLVAHAERSAQLGCTDNAECVAQLAQALASDLAIKTEVDKLGEVWVASLALIDVKAGKVVKRAAERASDFDAMVTLAASLAVQLVSEEGGEGGGAADMISLAALGSEPSFAVVPLRAEGVGDSVVQGLSESLVVEISQFQGVTVFSQSDLQAMLDLEAQKQLQGCDDVSCMAEIGGAVGARFLVTGTVADLEGRHLVSLRVIDTKKVRAIASSTESFRGPAEELLQGVRFLVRRTFGLPVEGQGQLRLAVAQSDINVRLNGADLGLTPSLEIPSRIPAGKHTIEVSGDGYYPLVRETYVEPARITSLDLRLEPLPTPWYKTWWFWTAVSAVVVGGTSAAVLLSRDTSGPPQTGGGQVGVELP